MNCPMCSVPLQMTERKSVEIDYCPKCRGVWLDRGELDKLLEADRDSHDRRDDRRDDDRRYDRDREYEHKKYYKKKSILGELFDF